MSLLNIEVKLSSEVLSKKVKILFLSLIGCNETVYVKNKFIKSPLVSGILETTDIFKMKGFLSTIEREKAFNSINHFFFQCVKEI